MIPANIYPFLFITTLLFPTISARSTPLVYLQQYEHSATHKLYRIFCKLDENLRYATLNLAKHDVIFRSNEPAWRYFSPSTHTISQVPTPVYVKTKPDNSTANKNHNLTILLHSNHHTLTHTFRRGKKIFQLTRSNITNCEKVRN